MRPRPSSVRVRPRGPAPSLALAAAAALALAACDRSTGPRSGGPVAGGPRAEETERPVRAAALEVAPWPRVIYVSGELAAAERVTVRAEVTGPLVEVRFDLGDRVAAGQVLARVDDAPLRLDVDRAEAALAEARARVGWPADPPHPRGSAAPAVCGAPDPGGAPVTAGEGVPNGGGGAAPRPGLALPAPDEAALDPEAAASVRLARAQLAEARANHARVLKLRAERIATPADQDVAEAALRAGESRVQQALETFAADRVVLRVRRAELAQAHDRLARAVVAAPFAAVVAARPVGPGERVAPGDPVAVLVRTDPLRLAADVPELEALALRPGLAVRALVDGRRAAREGALARVAPAIDPVGRTRRVEADLPNPGGALPAGVFARLELVLDPDATALAAPLAAVRTFAGLDKLVLVREGKAREVLVTLGRRDPVRGLVEVVAGATPGAPPAVAPGDLVVLDPGGLPDGARVRLEGP